MAMGIAPTVPIDLIWGRGLFTADSGDFFSRFAGGLNLSAGYSDISSLRGVYDS